MTAKKEPKEKLKVEIEWELLERIAAYYEFPVAVFLGDIRMFRNKTKNKTRNKVLVKKAELLDKILNIILEELAETNKTKSKR